MGRKKRAPETTSIAAAFKSRMAAKGASTSEMVHAFIKQHADVLEREKYDHFVNSLTTIFGHEQASSPRSSAAQLEMFVDYDLEKTVLIRLPDGKRVHRQLQSLTRPEAKEHLLYISKPKNRPGKKTHLISELTRLLDDLEPHMRSAQTTIGEGWIEFREHNGG
ncbi:hypothetical protein KQX63_12945 [Rhodopseudomonas palustris]|uniref:hypothetical protein n=1 Tax=Rhodopseudomonas palustris TaxID=1076 RepID=UPI0021F3C136|nr:hypothetical protein [Rhodopseudomonas palustris]UYO42321.1 hypothetical protein KQX63_12945 [Rhodopseudomonas palustris]